MVVVKDGVALDLLSESDRALAVEERNNCDFERISCDPERIFCEWRPVGGVAARPADRVNGSNQAEPRMP